MLPFPWKNMKKYTTFILMLSFALSLCASNDYASILERAMMSSSQIDTAYMNYQNGKLSARQAKLDDVTSYTVSADAGVVTADPDPDWYIRPTLTVVVPDDFDTTLTASLGKTGANRSGKYRISHPSLTISMNFDLTGYDEDELADAYDVSSIPCLVVFRGGAEVTRSIGLKPKDAVAALADAEG